MSAPGSAPLAELAARMELARGVPYAVFMVKLLLFRLRLERGLCAAHACASVQATFRARDGTCAHPDGCMPTPATHEGQAFIYNRGNKSDASPAG